MSALLAALLLNTPAAEHVCLNSADVVGFEPQAGQAAIDSVRNALAALGVTVATAQRSNPADDRCSEHALGVLHLTAVRAGDAVLYELRTQSDAGLPAVEFESPLNDTTGLTAHVLGWVEPLRARRQAIVAAPAVAGTEALATTEAPAVTATTPQPADHSIGWGPIVLWTAGGAALLAAGGYELSALQIHRSEQHYALGEKRQDTARVLATAAVLSALSGTVWWWLD